MSKYPAKWTKRYQKLQLRLYPELRPPKKKRKKPVEVDAEQFKVLAPFQITRFADGECMISSGGEYYYPPKTETNNSIFEQTYEVVE